MAVAISRLNPKDVQCRFSLTTRRHIAIGSTKNASANEIILCCNDPPFIADFTGVWIVKVTV
jgi:hypothetical protein